MEAKAKVKDIAISRERVTLRDVLHEGTLTHPQKWLMHGIQETSVWDNLVAINGPARLYY